VNVELTVILAAIGLVATVLGYLIKSMVGDMRADTNANTDAIRRLNDELISFRVQLAERQAADARSEAAELRAAAAARGRRGRWRWAG